MKTLMRSSLALVAGLVLGLGLGSPALAATAAPAPAHVVDAGTLQARLDRATLGQEASRQSILLLLQRADIRAIADRAGLDIQRASSAVAVLSDAQLEALGAQAAEINAGVGGSDNIVISATALIIILLIIIIVAN